MAIRVDKNFTEFVVLRGSVLSFQQDHSKSVTNLRCLGKWHLQGVLTDGDFRRWIAGCSEINLNRPVTAAMNSNCRAAAKAPAGDPALFSIHESLRCRYLQSWSHRRNSPSCDRRTQIGSRRIGDNALLPDRRDRHNHNGNFNTAIQPIDAAHMAGADCAKFQMRDMSRAPKCRQQQRHVLRPSTQYTWINAFNSRTRNSSAVLTMPSIKLVPLHTLG